MKTALILLLAKIFDKGILFLFFMFLAQQFGKNVFGEFTYYFTIATIFFVLFNLGGEFYQIREFTKVERLKNFNTIFFLKTLVFFFFFFLVYIVNKNIYLFILLCSFYIESLISIFRSSLYKNNKYILEAKFTVIEKLIFIFLVFANIVSIKNILFMYLAFLLSKIVYILILSNSFYKLKYILKLRKTIDINFAKYYLINSWSYVLHALLVIIFVQIDIIMLKHMGISFGDIGLYSSAVKIYMTVIIIADVLFKLYYPQVAMLIHKGDKESLRHFVLKIQNMNLFFSVYFTLITMLFAKEIIIFAFGKEFIEATKMLIALSIVIIFRFSMYTYTAILSSSNFNYIKLYTLLTCAIVNIGLNYILIPIYGVYGALFAKIITELLLVVLFKISSYKVVFTNIITLQEILVLLAGIAGLYIFINFDLKLITKVIILILMSALFIINCKDVKQKLNFRSV